MQLCTSYCLTMGKKDKIADTSFIFYQVTEEK